MKTIRNTRQRQAVLEVVRHTDSHPDAAWVYERVRTELPNISLGTVYRALDTLVAQGELIKIQGAGDAARFDVPHPHMHHFLCAGCGRILDLPLDLPDLGALRDQLPAGVVLSEVSVVLRGRCDRCPA